MVEKIPSAHGDSNSPPSNFFCQPWRIRHLPGHRKFRLGWAPWVRWVIGGGFQLSAYGKVVGGWCELNVDGSGIPGLVFLSEVDLRDWILKLRDFTMKKHGDHSSIIFSPYRMYNLMWMFGGSVISTTHWCNKRKEAKKKHLVPNRPTDKKRGHGT